MLFTAKEMIAPDEADPKSSRELKTSPGLRISRK